MMWIHGQPVSQYSPFLSQPYYGYTEDTLHYAAQLNVAALAGMEPATAAMARQLIIDAYQQLGIQIVFYDTWRTFPEQAELFSHGRTTAGNVVTDAQAGYSWHNYGRAGDFYIMLPTRQASWNNPHYNEVGKLAQQLGFNWGGLFNDPGHVENRQGTTLAALRAANPGWEQYQVTGWESSEGDTPTFNWMPVIIAGSAFGLAAFFYFSNRNT